MKKIISSNPTRIKSSIIVASKFKMSKNKNQSNNFDNSYITIVNNSDTEEKNKNEDFLSNAHNNITKILSGFINDFEEEDENVNYIKKDTIKNVKKIIEKKNRISFANDIKNNKNSSNKKIIRKSKKQHTVKLPPSKLNISLQQIENDIKDNLNQEKKELKKSLIINNKDFHDFFNLSIDQSHENLLKKDNFNSNRNLKSFSKHAKNILKNNNENDNNEINNNNNNEINKNNNEINNNNNNNNNNENKNNNEINNNNNNNEINNNNNEINNNNNNNKINNNNNNIFNFKSSNLLHIQKQRSFNKNKNRFLKSFKKSSSINQTNLFSAKKQLKKFSLNEIKKSNTPKKNNRRNTISNILLKNLPKRISKNLDNIFFPQNSIKSTKKTIDILNINGLTNKNILELNDIKNKLKNEIIGNETNFNSNSNNNKNIKNSLIKNKEFFSDKDLNKQNFNNNKKLIEFRYRKLFIKKLVYDSLDDSEIESEEIETFFIYPFSIYNIIIDFLVSLFAIFDLIYTPLNLSYLNNYCKETEFNFDNIYNFIIEILYIIDLIKSFFVAYFNFEEILIENLNEIIIHYLSDWFFFDLLASIPIQNIFLLTINQCSITNTNDFDVTFVGNNKYIYIFVLLRQIKIFKIFSFNSFMLKFRIFLSKLESSSNYGKIFMSLFIFFIALHYIACIFIFIGKNYYPNWIVKNNLESNNFIDLYITSIYFMIATLTTVGYGDISTYNIWEKIFGLIMLLIGILGYSYAVSSLSNYIKNIDAKNLEYEKKCSILEEIKLIHPEIPDDLNDRILRYLKYKQFNEKKDKNIIMECLPNSLRNTLIYNMYRNIIENFIFFKNFKNTEFIVRVILKFKPILALKNDVLVKQGEFIEEIIFVKNGKLSLCISINKNIYQKATLNNTISKLSSSLVSSHQLKSIQTRTYHLDDFTYSNTKTFRNNFDEDENQDENVDILKILEIRKNEHFGDILMFLNKRSPLSVKAKTKYCELFYLNKTDAVEISTSFPLIWRKINKISLFNMEQIKRLINKVIKIYYSANGIENNDNNNNKVLTTIVSQYSKNSEEDDESELQSIPSSFTETTLSNIYQNNKNFMKFSGLKSKKNSKNNFDDEEDESSGYSDYVNNNNINNNNNVNNNVNEKKNVVLKRSKKSIIIRKKSISILNDINNENNNNNNENNNNSFKLSLESINDNNNNNNNKLSHKEKFSISINDSKTLDNIKEKENESDSSSMVNTSNNNIFSNNFTNNNNNSNRSDRSNKSYSIFSQKTTKINVNNTNTIDFSETNSVSDKNDQFNNFNDNNNNNNVKKTPFQPNEINQETYSNEEVIEKNDLIHLNKNYNEINLNNNKKEETLISFSSMTNKEPFFNNFSNQFKDFFDKNKIIFNENNNNNNNINNNNNNKNSNNNKENKNKNIFIFSNEININLNSSYENINTLSNFTYIKDKNLQNKIKNILTNKETINNNNNNKNNNNNNNNDKNDNEIFIRNINKSSTNKSESPKLFSKRKTQILNSNTLINYPRHNSIQKNKHYFKSFSIIPEYNNEMFKSNRKNNNNNNNNENNVINLIPMNNNSSNKKSKNLLNVISQNIKRNNMNLNNPDEFYSEYFSNIINKTSIKKEKKV